MAQSPAGSVSSATVTGCRPPLFKIRCYVLLSGAEELTQHYLFFLSQLHGHGGPPDTVADVCVHASYKVHLSTLARIFLICKRGGEK